MVPAAIRCYGMLSSGSLVGIRPMRKRRYSAALHRRPTASRYERQGPGGTAAPAWLLCDPGGCRKTSKKTHRWIDTKGRDKIGIGDHVAAAGELHCCGKPRDCCSRSPS